MPISLGTEEITIKVTAEPWVLGSAWNGGIGAPRWWI